MFLLVPAYPGNPGQKAVKRLCVCVFYCRSQMVETVEVIFTGWWFNVLSSLKCFDTVGYVTGRESSL